MSAADSTRRQRAPTMGVTSYDRATAVLIAACFFLAGAVLYLVTVWISNLRPAPKLMAAMEIIESPGGDPDGAPGETLLIESPEPEITDPSPAEEVAEQTDVQEQMENITDIADDAALQENRTFEQAPVTAGKPGSAKGTGRKPLGMGGGKGGIPREQRWFVNFSERGTLEEYTAQLDYFGIELGVLLPDGKLTLISNLTAARPMVRTLTNGADEKRLYMTWRGGSRKALDLQIFQKAGVNASQGLVMHFYPQNTENMLANLELQYRNKKADQIKRTYFVVRKTKDGYEFAVSSQTYLK